MLLRAGHNAEQCLYSIPPSSPVFYKAAAADDKNTKQG